MTRGVLYVKWGRLLDRMLERSIRSLQAVHPELPHHVHELPATARLTDKSRLAELSPFDQTVYLDADTIVLDDLSYGFAKAEQFGLACSICECPYARRYGLSGDLVEYNTGVLFFTRRAAPILNEWPRYAAEYDGVIPFQLDGRPVRTSPNDQAGFAKAVEESGVAPFVLPQNWNFRPQWQRSFFGPIKVWHDYQDVPPAIRAFNDEQRRPGAAIRYGKLD